MIYLDSQVFDVQSFEHNFGSFMAVADSDKWGQLVNKLFDVFAKTPSDYNRCLTLMSENRLKLENMKLMEKTKSE